MTQEPREHLKTAGLLCVEVKGEHVFCGFVASCSIEFPVLSGELLKRKLDNVKATGAGLLEETVFEC